MTRRAATLAASFRYASAGLRYFFATQRNARIQAAAGAGALVLAALLRLPPDDLAILVSVIALVLVLETVNTALEALVDLVTQEYHPLAKQAKDLAAGAVWLAALASLAVGALLFVPRLWPLVRGRL
jgi:diacylglycerol kinase